MKKLNIQIVGKGVVGRATASVFEDCHIAFYDPPLGLYEKIADPSFVFICVPERYVWEALEEWYRIPRILVVRSTLLPGQTEELCQRFGTLLYNPCFARHDRAVEDEKNPHRVIIGGPPGQPATDLVEAYSKRIPAPVFHVSYRVAELVKYSSNAALAMKVIFANQIYEIAAKVGIKYHEIEPLLAIDPRIGGNLKRIKPGFGGPCLPKDLDSLISFCNQQGIDASLLKVIRDINERLRGRRYEETAEETLVGLKAERPSLVAPEASAQVANSRYANDQVHRARGPME